MGTSAVLTLTAMAAVGRVASSLASKGAGLVKSTQAYATPRLQTFWKYAKVELKPPSLAEMPQVSQGFSNLIKSAKTGKYTQVSVREAALNTLVTAEILCWFFAGECIGKGNLIGYQVPGGTDFALHF